MRTKTKGTQTKTINKQVMQVRYVNGIKTYYKAGSWYCDWNNYQQVRQQQGIGTNIDVFCSWCISHDLEPTG